MSWEEIITDVAVDGNKRISKETLIIFGGISKGTDYTDEDLNEVLKKIYSTKFFKNINLKIENSILNISVIENDSTYILEVFACLDSKKNEDCLVIQSEATYADVKQCELQASQVNNDLLDVKERGLMLNLSCKAIDTNIFAKKQNLSIYQIDS